MGDVPTVNVGKAGVTDEIIRQINLTLDKRKRVRIKFLPSARSAVDRHALAEDVAARSRGHLVDVRGNTCILSKDKP